MKALIDYYYYYYYYYYYFPVEEEEVRPHCANQEIQMEYMGDNRTE